MISKELLNEVLQKEAEIGGKSILGESYIEYKIVLPSGGKLIRDVNIYELAHKCKGWATENKYTILTENMYPNGYFAYVLSNEQSIENYGYLKAIKDIPHNKTEPEAIFKACQWILENK